MSGLRFGRLLVTGKAPEPKMWACICDCGAKTTASGHHLRSGAKRSCGCLAREWASHLGSNPDYISKRTPAVTKHGCKRKNAATPEYKTWLGMKRRCYDEKCKDFPGWGGRGIRVCDRWNKSFEAFLSDMGEKPTPRHTIDRIDHDGHYEPGNCRWATLQEQGGENRRGLQQITIDGITFPSLGSAAKHFGVRISTAHERIRAGIPPEIAVSHSGRMVPRRSKESYLPHGKRTSTNGQS